MDLGPLVPIAFFASAAFAVVGVAVARAVVRLAEMKRVDSAPDTLARLERMEQAIDAIAFQVDRVAEAQRFTTQLLSEKAGTPGRS
ncbi:MAG: hypothetical protein MNPFHGCM_01429 [Gemmatimonadaceae bacterium]|nr:hypothetical protein [Gemmatimonadaceae bacterium]